MSSTEPPSRNQLRNQSQDNKSIRDELSSKGRVEKVRAVDADEQTRKNQFQKYYKDAEDQEEEMNAENHPRPIDLYSSQEEPPSVSSVDEDPVSNPSYSTPPTVHSFSAIEPTNESPSTGALPQSEAFWNDFSMPDEPQVRPNFEETLPKSQPRQTSSHKKEKPTDKKMEPSPFGPPGKVVPTADRQKKKEAPFSPLIPPKQEEKTTIQARPVEKKEEKPTREAPRESTKRAKQAPPKTPHQEPLLMDKPPSFPMKEEEEPKEKNSSKTISIEGNFSPSFPPSIQPIAVAATTQAAPYLSPSTMNVFFQMVGTIYVMTQQSGVSRTEIVLNNPSFASSRFFGSTITIEKYATAPDSFNIRLTGANQQAVVSFKENIPSLMNAFQNGNFAFRIQRIDAEYTTDRPIFRRKEKGEGRGEAGGDNTNLRDRRK